MTIDTINYEAVLADLQERRSQIEAAIAAIQNIIKGLGANVNGSQRVTRLQDIPSDAFFTMSIADATVKYLGMVKSKQTTEEITRALEHGGLPPVKYESVYALLRRRANQVGDIVRVGDDWGLAAWYPNNPNFRRRAKGANTKAQTGEANGVEAIQTETNSERKAATEDTPKPRKGSIGDACEDILTNADRPIHISALVAELSKRGINTNKRSLSGNLPQDSKKRFKNLGGNTWVLTSWPESKYKSEGLPI